ncbi:hypothetical protein B0H14DRAFT_2608489 [Mycena olivaceomarginata]|nr:hypothetical protein B0H14DRAFT_2608489 [Mycena olivaceomarginata]
MSRQPAPHTTPESNPFAAADILAFDGAAALAAEKAAEPQTVEPHSVWIKLDDADDEKKHTRRLEGLFAILVAVNKSQVALAILQCTIIKSNTTNSPTYLDSAPIAEIGIPDTPYAVTGQILSLVPFKNSSDTISFVAFESAKAKQANSSSSARMRHLSICVDGRLVLPLSSPDLMPTRAVLEDLAEDVMPDVAESVETTWVFSDSQLDALKATLLTRVQDEDVRLKIPVYSPVKDGKHPYETQAESTGSMAVVNAWSVGKKLQQQIAKTTWANTLCFFCAESQKNNILVPVSPNYPCGFCGKNHFYWTLYHQHSWWQGRFDMH